MLATMEVMLSIMKSQTYMIAPYERDTVLAPYEREPDFGTVLLVLYLVVDL